MMNSLFKLIAGICLFLSALLFSACKNSYDEMIVSYNEKNMKTSYQPPEPYTTHSKHFKENEILDEFVCMGTEERIILTAPDGGEGCLYEWKALVPSKNEKGKDFIESHVIGNERTLNYLAPGVFKTDRENKLIVTVTEKSGKQYTDTAKVFIDIE